MKTLDLPVNPADLDELPLDRLAEIALYLQRAREQENRLYYQMSMAAMGQDSPWVSIVEMSMRRQLYYITALAAVERRLEPTL